MELRTDAIYTWMNQQIKAEKLRQKQLYLDANRQICIVGTAGKEIHVFRIRELARLINVVCDVVSFNERLDEYYFWYKGWRFFGLVNKEYE